MNMMKSWASVVNFLALTVAASTSHAGAINSTLPCLIHPQTTVVVGSPATGVLETVKVSSGDLVKAGDVVAMLESSLEQAEVAVAQGKADMESAVQKSELQAAFSHRKVTRAKDLNRTSAIAQHELDEAETEERVAEVSHREALEHKRQAELELKRAETALALRTVKSPITGVVVERYFSPGELVKLAPILKVAQLDPLRVEAFAPASWLGKVKSGMRGEVRVESPGLGPFHAKVTVINPVVESAAGTFVVRLELPNPQHRIPAGVACTVKISPE
jgi:RND family efflux transporter MFP subunit